MGDASETQSDLKRNVELYAIACYLEAFKHESLVRLHEIFEGYEDEKQDLMQVANLDMTNYIDFIERLKEKYLCTYKPCRSEQELLIFTECLFRISSTIPRLYLLPVIERYLSKTNYKILSKNYTVEKHGNPSGMFTLLKDITLTEHAKTEVEIENMKLCENSFKSHYSDPHNALDHYEHYIREGLIKVHHKSKSVYYALYGAVIQSSGYGKSRMLIEAGNERLNTLYACFRPKTSTGYPYSNVDLYDFLWKNNTQEFMRLFLSAVYKIAFQKFAHAINLEDKLDRLPLSEFAGPNNDGVFFGSFWNEVIELCENQSTDVFKVIQDYEVTQKRFDSELQKVLKRNPKNLPNRFNGLTKLDDGAYILSELVVVFDEAKILLLDGDKSIFKNLQRAQQALGSKNMVLVFTDTLAAMMNFVPASERDSSFRPTKSFDLLPPFYEILTFDSFTNEQEEECEVKYLYWLFSLGRPMWKALYLTGEPGVMNLVDLLKFAILKLAPLPSLDDMEKKRHKIDSCLAVLSIKFGIDGIMDHSLATRLMASYMGTGMFVDKDRIRMKVEYPTEPILAEASSHIFYRRFGDTSTDLEFDPKEILKFLDVFFENFINGLISAGEVGELLARIILSLSFDYVSFKKFKQNPEISFSFPHVPDVLSSSDIPLFSRALKLEEFLDGLVDPTYRADFQTNFGTSLYLIPEELRDSEVAFTSWSFLQSFPDEIDIQVILKDYFDRRAAMVLPLNHPGADFLLPLRLSKKNQADFVYSCILIQVKNRDNLKKNDHFLYGGDKLTPIVCLPGLTPPHMSILMELGEKATPLSDFSSPKAQKRDAQSTPKQSDKKMDIIQFRRSYPSHILLIGFESLRVCLMEHFRLPFVDACRRQVDNIDYANRKNVLEIMAPLRYIPGRHICGCATGCMNNQCGCRKLNLCCTPSCKCSNQGSMECQNH